MIEQLRKGAHSGAPPQAVIFDFDGTLTLVRAGWMPLMLDMMMETLGPLAADGPRSRSDAEVYVARLTGKDTVHQMRAFAEHVRALGGLTRSPEDYKAEFLARIGSASDARLTALQRRELSADDLMVPGSRALLERLRAAGLRIFLASGTDHEVVCTEAKLLGIDHCFEAVHGSAPGGLSKLELLNCLVDSGVPAARILMFGDGQVEIADTRQVGGIAVGVASDEPHCLGIDLKKRAWLIRAGADYIIPNYLEPDLLRVVAGIA
ncbi:MAG TPA: HAD family hydrolase [Bryobacteraceae bacterium]|nr:HAD family hydrolase [Bryobacteraceae bacterium]